MDSVNQNIISLLRANCQESNKAIAQQLDISEVTVATRIAAMNKNGILRVKLQWNAPALGLNYMAQVMIDPGVQKLDRITRQLTLHDEIIALVAIAGEASLLAVVLVADSEAFAEFLDNVLGRVQGLRIIRCQQVISIKKMKMDWGAHTAAAAWMPKLDSLMSQALIDDFDVAMLLLLKDDARISNREVARQLNVSETKIRQRMVRLKEQKVVRISAVVDPVAILGGGESFVEVRAAPGHIEAVCAALVVDEMFPAILKTAGNYSIQLLALGVDLKSQLTQIRQRLGGLKGVESIAILPIIEVFKHRYELAWLD